MAKKTFPWLSLIGLILALTMVAPMSQADPSTGTDASGLGPNLLAKLNSDESLNSPGQATIESLNRFSFNLYRTVAKEKNGNLAVSPLGSYILSAMLEPGAQGPAKQAISKALALDSSTLESVRSLMEHLELSPSLNLAQKIYLASQVSVTSDYLDQVTPFLEEPTENVSFREDPLGAVKIINDWVEDKTAGLITDFLLPLPKRTISVLVSVLHFKGQWANPFDPKDTKVGTFTRADGTTLSVPMMTLPSASLTLRRTKTGQLLTLPYADQTECLLFLPDPGQSPESLLEDSAGLVALKSQQKSDSVVKLELPRFEFETDTFELTPAWKALGLAPLLSRPDLTPMLGKKLSRDLDLKVFHKTYIKADEEGTEAAAATAVVITLTSAPDSFGPQVVRFDRPFLFLLRNSESKAIFMLGRVDHPEEWSGK